MAHIEQKVSSLQGLELGKIAVGSFPSFTAAFIPILFFYIQRTVPEC